MLRSSERIPLAAASCTKGLEIIAEAASGCEVTDVRAAATYGWRTAGAARPARTHWRCGVWASCCTTLQGGGRGELLSPCKRMEHREGPLLGACLVNLAASFLSTARGLSSPSPCCSDVLKSFSGVRICAQIAMLVISALKLRCVLLAHGR